MSYQKQAVLLLYINPENGQEVLSVSRKDNHAQLGLPGGKVETDETLIQGLCREFREEIGVSLDPNCIEFLFQDWDTDYDTLTYVYSGTLKLPPTPFINTEGARVEYVSAAELISPEHSPFSEYNLKMFKEFISNLDFISFQKNSQ